MPTFCWAKVWYWNKQCCLCKASTYFSFTLCRANYSSKPSLTNFKYPPKLNLTTQNTLLKSIEEKEDQVILACLKGEKSSYLFLLETTNKKRGFFNAWLGLCHSFYFLLRGKRPFHIANKVPLKYLPTCSPNILQQS